MVRVLRFTRLHIMLKSNENKLEYITWPITHLESRLETEDSLQVRDIIIISHLGIVDAIMVYQRYMHKIYIYIYTYESSMTRFVNYSSLDASQ